MGRSEVSTFCLIELTLVPRPLSGVTSLLVQEQDSLSYGQGNLLPLQNPDTLHSQIAHT